MFKTKTVFIVGAGASKEFGLPTGAELKKAISDSLNITFPDGYHQTSGDRVIVEALRRYSRDPSNGRDGNINPFLHAARMVRDAMPQAISIDNFIDAHRNDKNINLIGKMAIVREILLAEAKSKIYFSTKKDSALSLFRDTEETWLSMLFKIASEGVSTEQVESIFENISFIIFNYDRCVEHYLSLSLQNYYRLNEFTANKIIDRVRFIHPYGQVGFLPWQNRSTGVVFGEGGENAENIISIAQKIKTFTEQLEDNMIAEAMGRTIQNSEKLVFLGFAYHEMNMQLMAPAARSAISKVFGTAKGMSKSDVIEVDNYIVNFLKNRRDNIDIEIRNDLTCFQLFKDYWRSLSK